MKNSDIEKLESFSAYQGGSWRARGSSHEQECSKKIFWSFQGLNSEHARLKEVLLYKPPKTPPLISKPEKAQHLRPVSWSRLAYEISLLEKVFMENGVKVSWLEADCFPNSPPNLMFVRDHFFMTPWGAILGRMASTVRAGEEKWAQIALARQGIAILEMIRGRGTFEGADALWVNSNTVLVGTGNRTNREGFLQLKSVLAQFKVRAFSVPLPHQVQHLLGVMQIVGGNRVLIRTKISGPEILRALRNQSYEILAIPEIPEVTHGQGLNIVTLSPGRVIMPAGCPFLRNFYKKNHIRVLAEVPIPQHLNAAGGIACATGILSRSLS